MQSIPQKHPFQRLALLLMAIVAMASAPTTAAANATTNAASTAIPNPLRISLSDDATTLDPHVADLSINNRLLNNIYEGLIMRDKDFKLAPALAVSWSQPDAKTWRFKLRRT